MNKIFKFGGTSVGSADHMKRVAEILRHERPRITVLSAMSGVTDMLVRLSAAAAQGEFAQADALIAAFSDKLTACYRSLLKDTAPAAEVVDGAAAELKRHAAHFEPRISGRAMLSKGELATSAVFAMYLRECGMQAELLHAPSFMVTLPDGQVDTALLRGKLSEAASHPDIFYITQGFICTDAEGRVDNLGRGGSDYSAALMGVALGASEVQIWTDIDGMHNNDPRIVTNTRPIRRLHFDEAAELAYFGAKILHPATIQPCKDHNIPVMLKNTMDPAAPGTVISNDEGRTGGFRAVAAKDGITSIRICSSRMLMAYGFLRRVFEVFEKYRTPIDMITTSEVAVSLTVDSDAHLAEIEAELQDFGTVDVERDNSIVCIVGCFDPGSHGMAARIFQTLADVPVKMISYGASNRSVAILVDTAHKNQTLQSLNDGLF